ncbi:MAG TPA: hypothetical protein VEG38_18460 [Acidimicrobiia bacterium]|nr:hypothetical protein [Acidimicrobiia bacterium]
MKRPFAVLAGLVVTMLLGPVPAADAVGAGVCTISGTIRFTPSSAAADRGLWDINPAVIQCRGMFNVVSSPRGAHGVGEQFTGAGQRFTGAGSYKTVPSADGGCLHELGEGEVDYWIVTQNQDVHMQEKNAFLLAGAGTFTTPTLYGSFQIPLHDGQCLTGPATTALFLAEVMVVRTSGKW